MQSYAAKERREDRPAEAGEAATTGHSAVAPAGTGPIQPAELGAIRERLNGGPTVRSHWRLGAALNGSPRVVAQTHLAVALSRRSADTADLSHAVVQRAWAAEVQVPAGQPTHDDWYRDRHGKFSNLLTGETYDPATHVLENGQDWSDWQELDQDGQRGILTELFGRAPDEVFVDDGSGKVYDPVLRRLYPSRGSAKFQQLDAARHRELMEQIQFDIDYTEYVDSGQAAFDDGYERGQADIRSGDPYDDETRLHDEHIDAYQAGYAWAFEQLEKIEAKYRGGGRTNADRRAAFPGREFSAPVAARENSFEAIRDAQFVAQDFAEEWRQSEELYYHIGGDLAYTFYMSTCTAIALYDEATGLSFLAHKDAGNEDRLEAALAQFLIRAQGEGAADRDVLPDIQVDLYIGSVGLGRHSSSEIVLATLRRAVSGLPFADAFMENVNLVQDNVNQGTIVLVGGGQGARVARQIVRGDWHADMAINAMYLGLHEMGDSTVKNLLSQSDPAKLVDDYEEIARAAGDLFARTANVDDLDPAFEAEVLALWNLKKAVADEIERRERYE